MTRHLAGWTILLLLCAAALAPALAAEPSPAAAEFFEKQVRPLLVERCFACHGNGKSRGGLSLTSRAAVLEGGDSGPAALAGQPEKSRLIRAVRHADELLQMPPKKKLPQKELAVLERWVKMGLPWPREIEGAPKPFQITPAQRAFWSYQPVKAGPPPAVKDSSWPRSPLDNFVLAGLERKGLSPAPPADRRTLLRRATFDLTGLPPTPEEMAAFLADRSPGAFARVVDRLLASPRYGERWGRHWLDVVRYADARDLIQLPPASDFREAWRYRDWVVRAFNRDLPYRDFVRYQVAGDLLQPRDPEQMNQDALVATGMLAIADFVPGDVDKDLMIADYVNDQIDVVGRGFMGLTLACARCHDHKFDPVSTEDYYGLAGIFFSTRLVPGPVAGNTPLVRAPLLPRRTIERARAKYAADLRRRAEVQHELAVGADKAHLASLKRLATTQTARYLVAACEYTHRAAGGPAVSLADLARERKLHPTLLAGWVDFLGAERPTAFREWRARFREAAAGKLDRPGLERSARELQRALVEVAARLEREAAARPPEQKALAEALVLRFRADDPDMLTNAKGQVTLWPNRGTVPTDAAPAAGRPGPLKATAKMAGRDLPVLRFTGGELLEARRSVPPAGSLFAVYAVSRASKPGQRLVGWEDAAVGRHGLGLMLGPTGDLHAILRNDGRSGDVLHARKGAGELEMVTVTWGERGTTLHRGRVAAGASKGIRAISSGPGIEAMRIGGPGSGGGPSFHGDLAEVRVYGRQLDDAARARVEAELHAAWFSPAPRKGGPVSPGVRLYEELVSPRGPFWLKGEDRALLVPADVQARLAALRRELAGLKNVRPLVVPEAVVVQDGGPKGTRHEGFRDAHVFVRGNHKKLGKKVPRRFPVLLAGDRQPAIVEGSGRLQLADWLTRPEHPLTARVMVNRIWQHHFGEGIVRTPNNFGERGERPTHPELLDYLAHQFVESGWSVKAMHRLIMLSSAYRQSGRASAAALAGDPDNRLFGRANRRRLEAEAIRDSLLAVAGRLDYSMGGPAFQGLAVPRRTNYLMSARTGANTSDFGALFDRADPTSIVEKRSASTVAPQALFFLNDPFVVEQAKALAERLAREAGGPEEAIRRLYAIVFGRPPTRAEEAVGLRLLAPVAGVRPLERYCHVVLCTNEFLYVE